jgi:thiaminase (transcriptional activator TenA)
MPRRAISASTQQGRSIIAIAGQETVYDSLLQTQGQVAGEPCVTERKALIRKHFITTSRYEYLFFDAAHKRETWPVSPRG